MDAGLFGMEIQVALTVTANRFKRSFRNVFSVMIASACESVCRCLKPRVFMFAKRVIQVPVHLTYTDTFADWDPINIEIDQVPGAQKITAIIN